MPILENEISEISSSYLQAVDKRVSDAASLSLQEVLDADPFIEAEKEKNAESPQRLDKVQSDVFKESPITQVAAGMLDAFRETLNLPTDLASIAKGRDFGEGVGESIPEIPKSEGVVNNLVRSTSQFLTDFAPIQFGLGKIKFFAKGGKTAKIVQAEVAGALAGAAAFDPEEPRLSNMIKGLAPEILKPALEYLATDPGDTAADGRFKNFLEGLGLGALAEGLFSALRGVRGAKGLFKGKQALEGEVKQAGKAGIVTKEAAEEIPPLNLTGQETMDEFLGKVAKQDELQAKRFKAKRGKRSNFTSKTAADFLDIDKEFVKNLPEGTALNAESTIKVARVVAENLKEMEILAKRILVGTGTDEERALLTALRNDNALLDPKFFGVRGEAGRTLQIFNTLKPIVKRLQALTDTAESLGREGITDEQFAAMFLTLMKESDPKTTAKWLRISRRVPGMITEVWLSMLLTGIKTHVVNFMGNMSTLFLAPIERGVAAGFPGSSIARGEATAMLYGMTMAFTDALRLAGRTLKTGVADDTLLRAASKAEGFQRKLTSEAFELEKSGIAGRAVDMAGSFLTSPLRFLLASDVMFKHVNKMAQIHALAIREAVDRGLTGQRAGAFISDFVANPDQRTIKAAGDFASYQTFTNDVGKLGTAIQDFANAHMLVKMFLPFVRTPINIFKYSFERTPLAAAAKSIRLTLTGTNAVERDLAIARLGLGSMATAGIASMVMAGRITGSGPTNPLMRKQMEALGWKKNSFLVGGYHDGEKVMGGTYIGYSRFDPVGMGIGVVADLVEQGHSLLDYSQIEEVALGIVISFSRNMLSKTYVTGLQHAMDILTVGITGGDLGLSFNQAMRAGKSIQLSFIPTIVKDYKKAIDPVLRVQNTWWEGVKANMPYASGGLFPERNVFGDIVIRNVGVYSMANPFYISHQKDDLAMEELIKRDVKAAPVPRWIGGKKPRMVGEDDTGQGFFLTNEQHDFWKVETGKGLRSAIIKKMSTSVYRFKTSDVEKQKVLTTLIRTFKDRAKALMIERFGLEPRLRQKIQELEEAQAIISELIGG